MLHPYGCCNSRGAAPVPITGTGLLPRPIPAGAGGPAELLPGHRAETPACSTAHQRTRAAQGAWLGCSPFSSSPAELGGSRGRQPRCTQPTLTVSPLSSLLLLFPYQALLKGGKPTAPSPHTSPPKPFPSAPACSAAAARAGAARGKPSPTLSRCQRGRQQPSSPEAAAPGRGPKAPEMRAQASPAPSRPRTAAGGARLGFHTPSQQLRSCSSLPLCHGKKGKSRAACSPHTPNPEGALGTQGLSPPQPCHAGGGYCWVHAAGQD